MTSLAQSARVMAAVEREMTPEWAGNNQLDRQIARARREMGEVRWAALNAEWATPQDDGAAR